MMNTNNMNNSRERALKRVQEYSFAVDEARLYLDMHPDDEQAKRYFDKYNSLRKSAMLEYERQYGPLLTDNINAVKDGWKWTQGPMPWEMGV